MHCDWLKHFISLLQFLGCPQTLLFHHTCSSRRRQDIFPLRCYDRLVFAYSVTTVLFYMFFPVLYFLYILFISKRLIKIRSNFLASSFNRWHVILLSWNENIWCISTHQNYCPCGCSNWLVFKQPFQVSFWHLQTPSHEVNRFPNFC